MHKTDTHFTVDNNKTVFFKENGSGFIAFYAPWCGYCQQIAPMWNDYAQQFKGKSFFFLVVDCTDENNTSAVSSALKIRSYPTIKYVHPASNKVISTDGSDGTPMERSKEGIRNFLQSQNVL